MGFHSLGWKRILVVLGTLFLVLLLFTSRQNCYTKISEVQDKLSVCLHHSEALSSQLEVINKYKETVEGVLKNVRKNNDKEMQECKKRVSVLEMVSKNCGNSDEIKKLKEEIEHLKLQVEHSNRQKDSKVLDFQDAVVDIKDMGKVEEAKVVPVESDKNAVDGYAKGPDVHFARKRPMNEVLEFKRGEVQRDVPVEGWMEHKELVKKLNDREKEKVIGADVQDFRELAKPDGQEEDYKEMH